MRDPHLSRPREAVLLVAHGSRDPRASYVVSQLIAHVTARTGLAVRAAHLDFTSPAPVEALRSLAADGFERVRVVPLLFAPGYHVTHDVPAAVEASGVAGDLAVSVAPALLDSDVAARQLLFEALLDRVGEAADLDAVDGLVLASAGSSSPVARAFVEGAAEELAQQLMLPVVVGYASAAAPSVSRALTAVRRRGSRKPAVASLFVSPGRLPDGVVQAAGGAPVADPLGVTPAFVELLAAAAMAPAAPAALSG